MLFCNRVADVDKFATQAAAGTRAADCYALPVHDAPVRVASVVSFFNERD